ncbi:MAG TPA: hypothetical protein DF383_13625 [Deltaproteobacteria bacterium]|nr:hypothetical protein [Deltaproteobacteria bacterium]
MKLTKPFFFKKSILGAILLFALPSPQTWAQALSLPSLVSVNDTADNAANANSSSPRVSADGRIVVFQSVANDLVPNDVNGIDDLGLDIFARNLETGETILVSTTPNGQSGNNDSINPTVSADGRFVAFESLASDLLADPAIQDDSETLDVFVRDLVNGTTELVTVNVTGDHSADHGNTILLNPVISANGRFVAFESAAADLTANKDENGTLDIFVRDLLDKKTILVSVNADDEACDRQSYNPTISADGRRVAFQSHCTDLSSIDTDGWISQVFVRDLIEEKTEMLSVSPDGLESGESFSERPIISANGKVVAFESQAGNLTSLPDITGYNLDIFARDLDSQVTKLVSVNQAGTAPGELSAWNPALSADGRFVAFESGSNDLVPNDNNDDFGYKATDIFVRDLQENKTILASQKADGSGSGHSSSYVKRSFSIYTERTSYFSADGRFVAFESLSSDLVEGDTNGKIDLFVRDLQNNRSVMIPKSSQGSYNDNEFEESLPVLSAHGEVIAFQTFSNFGDNLDHNGKQDIYVVKQISEPEAPGGVGDPGPGAPGGGSPNHPAGGAATGGCSLGQGQGVTCSFPFLAAFLMGLSWFFLRRFSDSR